MGKRGDFMKQQTEFPVAHLTQSQLDQLMQIENQLREQTGEEIVLIAYEQKDQ
ncbi:hypothetical protein [Bacillus weihaiensis]|uniref:hypothetical protein n=1 Tax=Bacillus weihaiensis TaxID=1547283 RepID=UPI001314B14B|nr:hypothetical protein [Bacillus weihaiensis]